MEENFVALSRGRGPARLDHVANEAGADLGGRLILGERDISQLRGVANDARVGVAVNVGAPLPRRRVRVAGADVLGLQPLEFLLGAQLVGLFYSVD